MNPTLIGAVALLVMAASGVIWFRAALDVRLPENRLGFVAVWIVCGVGAIVSLIETDGGTRIPAILALLGASFFLFTFAISRQIVAEDAIAVGDILPAFAAPDENTQTFDSSELTGNPVLIKFFRGHW